MNKSEFKFLIINTKALWGKWKEKQNIEVTENGLSLEEFFSYTYAETFLTGSDAPMSIDLDPCGVLYILDALKEGILIFDLHTRNSYWIDCLYFPEPKSIAVSDLDVYVAYNGKISCLARVNYQIRWEREIAEDIRIASLGKDHLYVLDVKNKGVFKADREWNLLEIRLKKENDTDFKLDKPVDIASDFKNNIYILEADKREILKFNPEGRYTETIPIAYEEGLIPLALAVDSNGNIFLSFKGEKGVVLLKRHRKYSADGIYITKALDSTTFNCQWHKVVIDAEVPENTQIRLSYFASDEKYLSSNPRWSEPLVNPKDALLVNSNGQNIWFKIEMRSDDMGIKSPLIKSLKVYFPRLTYLRYLPATYQEDLSSKDFLERFLSLFETFLGDFEAKIGDVPVLFDIEATPKEFLGWLSTWVGAFWDENWEEVKWREFLSRAMQLYKQRGTRKGLSEIIKIFTGKYPIIVEPFQLRCTGEEHKKELNRLFGSDPYSFCVLLKPGQVKTETERNTVKRIIETEKPAHTNGGLQVLQPWIILGAHTYLEVNTSLSKPEFILGKAVLPIDTVLEEKEKGGQIERRSRIEIDTILLLNE